MRGAFLVITCCAAACSCLAADALKPVNSKVMLRGYCLAGSRVDKQAFGGYGTSQNHPKKLKDRHFGQEGQLSLIAFPDEADSFGQGHAGFRVLLVNRTRSEIALSASDSRVSIIQEGFGREGQVAANRIPAGKLVREQFSSRLPASKALLGVPSATVYRLA